MSNTNSSGPYISTGNLNTAVIADPDCGPDLSYQGNGIVDPRYVQAIGAAPGRKIQALYCAPYIPLIDAVPQAPTAAGIVAAAAVAVTTAVTAANAAGLGVGFISANLALLGQTVPGSGNLAQNIPIVPAGLAINSSNVVTVPLTLEFGYGFGGNIATTVSGSKTLTLASATNSKFFNPGQRLIVAGAGNAGGTSPLLTSVASVSGASVTMVDAALATLASGTQVGSADQSGLVAFPYNNAGIDTFLDPVQALSRVLRVVNTNVGDTGYSLIVRGYDYANVPMTETIAVTANGTAYGKKAWKYITQMNLWRASSTTTTGNISVGTGDVFGLNVRSDFWEYLNVYYNATFQTAAPGGAGNGWLAADATNPATGTTGDVRGTLQVSAAGGGANTFAGGAPNGVLRLAAFMSLPSYNALNATNLNYATLFGVTQYTA